MNRTVRRPSPAPALLGAPSGPRAAPSRPRARRSWPRSARACAARMTWARVVLPEPGGPQRISERSRRPRWPGAAACPGPGPPPGRGSRRACAGACGRRGGRRRRVPGTGVPDARSWRWTVGLTGRESRTPPWAFGTQGLPRRWRAASKSRMPAATPTFRLSTAAPHGDGAARSDARGPDLLGQAGAPRCPAAGPTGPAQVDLVVGRAPVGRRGRGRRTRPSTTDRGPPRTLGSRTMGEPERAAHGARAAPSRRTGRRCPPRGIAPRCARGLGRAQQAPRLPGFCTPDRDQHERRAREQRRLLERGRAGQGQERPGCVSASETEASTSSSTRRTGMPARREGDAAASRPRGRAVGARRGRGLEDR